MRVKFSSPSRHAEHLLQAQGERGAYRRASSGSSLDRQPATTRSDFRCHRLLTGLGPQFGRVNQRGDGDTVALDGGEGGLRAGIGGRTRR